MSINNDRPENRIDVNNRLSVTDLDTWDSITVFFHILNVLLLMLMKNLSVDLTMIENTTVINTFKIGRILPS